MSDKYSAYKRLSCAVIIRALDDLYDAIQKLKARPESADAERMEKECLRFFKSDRADVFLSFVDLENMKDRLSKIK